MKTQSSWKSLSCRTSELPVLLVNATLSVLMQQCFHIQSGGLSWSIVHSITLIGILISCNRLNKTLLVSFTLSCNAEWTTTAARYLSNCFISVVSSGRHLQVWSLVKRIKRLSKQQHYKYVLLRVCSWSWLWWGAGQVGVLYDTPHLIFSDWNSLANVGCLQLFIHSYFSTGVTAPN